MKSMLIGLVAMLALTFSAFAQGQIAFATYAPTFGINAYASNAVTGTLLTGAVYFAQLFYGPTGTTEEHLSPSTNRPATLNALGYVSSATGGGTRFTDAAVLPWNTPGLFQVRIWTAVMGDDYWTAYATWISGSNPTGIVASSNIFPLTAPAPLKPPVFMFGLEPIIYRGVPEPSIPLLVLVALPALVWHRRWSRSPRRRRELTKG